MGGGGQGQAVPPFLDFLPLEERQSDGPETVTSAELCASARARGLTAASPPRPAVHSVTLLLNLLACLAWFTVQNERGVDFGLSILWFVLFTPCAFLCWYRPIYKAFRQVPFPSATGTWLLQGGAGVCVLQQPAAWGIFPALRITE